MDKEIVDRVDALEEWKEETSATLSRHDTMITALNSDIKDIQIALANVATRDQVAALGAHFDHSINIMLRDALSATPQGLSMILAGITAIAGIAATVAGYMVFHQ